MGIMGRFDYRESNFSAGKFILCLLISLLVIALACIIYAIFASILGMVPGIIAGIGILALLIVAFLLLKGYSYSYQGPAFLLVFVPVIIVAFAAALLAGIGPLETLKKSLLSSFQSSPQQVVQISDTASPQKTDKQATSAGGAPATTVTPSDTAPNNTGSAPSATGSPTSTSTPTTAEIAALEQALHDEVNIIRRNGGMVSFQRIAFLDELARENSQYMLEQGKLTHENFYTYSHPTIIKTLKVSMAGENVLFVSTKMNDPALMADLWYQSADHRDNILNPSYRRTGVGIAIGNDRIYATQIYTD